MRSWHREFFVMPGELAEILLRLCDDDLWLLGRSSSDGSVVRVGVGCNADLEAFDRVALLPAKHADATSNSTSFGVGHTIVDPPAFEGDALLMARISLKTDDVQGLDRSLFRRLDRIVRSRLTHPVLVTNVVTKQSAVYEGVRCSSDVVEWASQGRELRQRAVANLRFAPLKDRSMC